MEGQLNLFDIDKSYCDYTFDRYGRGHKAPAWMSYRRCENCVRWVKYPTDEQPPSGWGCIGFCNEHQQRVKQNSYCQRFDDGMGGE